MGGGGGRGRIETWFHSVHANRNANGEQITCILFTNKAVSHKNNWWRRQKRKERNNDHFWWPLASRCFVFLLVWLQEAISELPKPLFQNVAKYQAIDMKITFFFLMLLGNGLLSCWHGLFKRVAKLVSVPRRFTSEFRSVPRGVSRKFGSTRGFKLRGSSGLPRVAASFKGCLPFTTNSRKFRLGCKW